MNNATKFLEYQAELVARTLEGMSATEAEIATLPDYLEWEASGYHRAYRGSRHGGGMAPEGEGFEVFELDIERTEAWAVEAFEAFEALDDATRGDITQAAIAAEIERIEP